MRFFCCMRPYYYSLDEYNKETFGKKLYKLSIAGGTTCPNRDGTKGTGGCIFCSGGGSGEFTPDCHLSVTEQLESAKARIAQKLVQTSDTQYIVYFQSYTATYAPIEVLRTRFTEALHWKQTAVLDIATRPDCLPPETLALLAELQKEKPVWVELGLQTANEKTAAVIRRGYENAVYAQAVESLHRIGIPVITHMILGLPGETREDMLQTVDYLNRVGTDGVKLQLLHVLRGTALADMAYTPLELPAYAELVCDCIAHLRPETVVHRITGDGDKRLLLAPLWSGNKKNVLNTIHKTMRAGNLRQGSAYKKQGSPL